MWGHERESEGEGEASTGYEKGTDTGNGHIWHRFIVSGTSHSKLIISTAQSGAWHSRIHFWGLASDEIAVLLSGGGGSFIIPWPESWRLGPRWQKLCCLLPLSTEPHEAVCLKLHSVALLGRTEKSFWGLNTPKGEQKCLEGKHKGKNFSSNTRNEMIFAEQHVLPKMNYFGQKDGPVCVFLF